jgi:hypothetical protein
MEFFSIPISIISLIISLGTFWLVFLRRGRLKMTTPTVLFFGYDHTPNPTAKVFVRTLLYCTATRGIVVEAMYASISSKGKSRVFSFWGYGETKKLTVGSGLHIGQSGFSANHHFISSVQDDDFDFTSGEYTVEVYARVVGKRKPVKLEVVKLELSDSLADVLSSHEGVLFERTIDGVYVGHARSRP